MVTSFDEQGCPVCRERVLTGRPLPLILVSVARYRSVYRCDACGSLWEESDRAMYVIDQDEFERWYGTDA